jgi:hypothetical protein
MAFALNWGSHSQKTNDLMLIYLEAGTQYSTSTDKTWECGDIYLNVIYITYSVSQLIDLYLPFFQRTLVKMSTETATETITQHSADYSNINVQPAADDATFQATARGNRSGTLKLSGIPIFTDLYEKRKWMKEHMAAAFRFFGKHGHGEGISGHISMRGERYLVTGPVREAFDLF